MNRSSATFLFYLPTIGILIFFILYYYCTLLYPGGSQESIDTIGFDWLHNYWCDLASESTHSQQPNPARPFAIASIIILASSLAVFFYRFPLFIPMSSLWTKTIPLTGLMSMGLSILIFTDFHDIIIVTASFFGLWAVVGIFVGLVSNNMKPQLWSAVFCGILIVINNVLYYGAYYYWLPLIQKITFC